MEFLFGRSIATSRVPLGRALSLGLVLTTLGCSAAYYGALETLGIEKRQLLRDRVEDSEKAQRRAKQQFEDALVQYRTVVRFEGGDLESSYEELKREYETSRERAQAVRSRIDYVERVAEDLFAEWERELGDYEDPQLRRQSQQALQRTRDRYDRLHRTMVAAERSMDPVLEALEDQVLFLKHSLNAQAIGSLADTSVALSRDVELLVQRMEDAIAEAQRFAQSLTPR